MRDATGSGDSTIGWTGDRPRVAASAKTTGLITYFMSTQSLQRSCSVAYNRELLDYSCRQLLSWLTTDVVTSGRRPRRKESDGGIVHWRAGTGAASAHRRSRQRDRWRGGRGVRDGARPRAVHSADDDGATAREGAP